MSKYEVLQGYYALHDELGSGGFGKVRLATHLLTNEKVAIKIIDKKQIGHDLPRVTTEVEALRNLPHQNICSMYHFIETEDKFFIVMEYCSGGEMFDYIVKKERLEESEARHFFRQLVSAIAFVHAQGYAHRDLKPENLLLTEDLHLKLIDFGLCAKTEKGHIDKHHLDTCCGSPAYAAPELIQGMPYKGNEADVWSMGILLYTLLVGALPFEDDNMQMMYRKIQLGNYYEPDWLSPLSKQLLRSMIQVQPSKRITVKKLLEHEWLNVKYAQKIKWTSIYEKNFIDRDVAREMASYYNIGSTDQMIEKIGKWNFDYMTATYHSLLHKKRMGMAVALPMRKSKSGSSTNVQNILCSPTIHASLDNNLDKSGLEEDDSSSSEDRSSNAPVLIVEDAHKKFVKPLSPERDKKMSYINAMLTMPSQFTGRSPMPLRNIGSPITMGLQTTTFKLPSNSQINEVENRTPAATPSRKSTLNRDGSLPGDKENMGGGYNYRVGAATCKIRGPIKIHDDGTRRSVYTTPNRPALRGLFSPAASGDTNCSKESKQRARSVERSGGAISGGSPVSIESSSSGGTELIDGRTPRSRTKTPRLGQRVFTSLERKKERLITLLTPRKMHRDSPQMLKDTRNMVNVSVTALTSAEDVRDELIKVFQAEKIRYDLNGWKIVGQKESVHGWMTVELEVVRLQISEMIGIRRKRLKGDAFLYKKVCERILQIGRF